MMIDRRVRYATASTSLAGLDDAEMASVVAAGPAGGVGIGGDWTVLRVDGVPVFAKRIPLSDVELAHPESTANLFELPTFCQYGAGGPSFSAWRELAANRIVTRAMLDGEAESFPLLYHWRVLPGRPPVAREHADIDAAVAALADSSAVRSRLQALSTASSSLVLFFEHIARPLGDWLREDPAGRVTLLEQQLDEIVAFLRARELLHMDGHFANIRSDGDRIFLADFGLATSPHFDLGPDEHEFVQRNVGPRRLRRDGAGQKPGRDGRPRSAGRGHGGPVARNA